jgi:hypothetical protein
MKLTGIKMDKIYEEEINRKIKDNKFYIIEIQMDENNVVYYENEFNTRKEAERYAEKFGSNFIGIRGKRLKEDIKKNIVRKGVFDTLS